MFQSLGFSVALDGAASDRLAGEGARNVVVIVDGLPLAGDPASHSHRRSLVIEHVRLLVLILATASLIDGLLFDYLVHPVDSLVVLLQAGHLPPQNLHFALHVLSADSQVVVLSHVLGVLVLKT